MNETDFVLKIDNQLKELLRVIDESESEVQSSGSESLKNLFNRLKDGLSGVINNCQNYINEAKKTNKEVSEQEQVKLYSVIQAIKEELMSNNFKINIIKYSDINIDGQSEQFKIALNLLTRFSKDKGSPNVEIVLRKNNLQYQDESGGLNNDELLEINSAIKTGEIKSSALKSFEPIIKLARYKEIKIDIKNYDIFDVKPKKGISVTMNFE